MTAIVHAREPRRTLREVGVPGTVALLAQLPVSLLCTAAHPLGIGLALGGDLSGALGALLLLGYAAAVALHAAAAPGARWFALLLPFYWLLHWAALLLALSDLVRDPAHWRKTPHGKVERGAMTDCSHYVLANPAVSSDPVWTSNLLVAPSQEMHARGCTSVPIELERMLTQKESQ